MYANDTLELLNGPEDGTEFLISSAIVDIGSGEGCAVRIRFDEHIRGCHARMSAIADGYRVRGVGGRTYVNGKRAGRVRSRIFRTGDVLRVGASDFYLHCALDGVASRKHGVPLESDLSWLVRVGYQRVSGVLGALWAALRRLLGPLFWPLVALLTVVLLVRWTLPGLFGWLAYHAAYWLGWLRFMFYDRLF